MGQKQTTTQKSEPWKPAQGALTDILTRGGEMYASGGMTTTPFEGQRVAGFGDVTQEAQQATLDAARAGSPMLSGMQGAVTRAMDPTATVPDTTAITDEALARAIPAATSMFSGSGMTDSSAAMEHVGRAAGGAVASAMLPYEFQARESAENRALQAANMAPGAFQSQFMPQQMIGQVGAQQDALSQAQINADMARYYEGQGADLAGLQNYANLATAIGGMGGTSQGTQYQPMGIGGALGILGSGLSLFSDRALKDNIVKIGETLGGTNVYSYNYKWSDAPQIGVIADEVPGAIAGTIGGYSVVDYGKVV